MEVMRENNYIISNFIGIKKPIRVNNTLGDFMNALLEISSHGLPDESQLWIECTDSREQSFEVRAEWHGSETVSQPTLDIGG